MIEFPSFYQRPLLEARRILTALTAKMLPTPSRQKLPYIHESAFHREYKILLHYLRYVRVGRSGLVRKDNRGVAGYLRHRREVARVALPRHRFKALADPTKIISIPPGDIGLKLSYDLDIYFGDVLSGDWDLKRAIDLATSIKHRSIHERFVLNIPWEETQLFSSTYAVRLSRGEIVRGADNVRDLAIEYAKRIDSLFESMKRDGFVCPTSKSGRPKTLPHVHIGRDGRFLFGNNGNHRLAIAKIIGLSEIPCWVRGRHLEWQKVRERVAAAAMANHPSPLPEGRAGHPDLKDLNVNSRTRSHS